MLHEVSPIFSCEAAVAVLFGEVTEQHRNMGDVQRIARSGQKTPVKSVVVMSEARRVIVSDRLGHTGDSVLQFLEICAIGTFSCKSGGRRLQGYPQFIRPAHFLFTLVARHVPVHHLG